MDGGASTPSTSSCATPVATRSICQDVAPNSLGGANMLSQLASDLQHYEAKTARFFKSLLPKRQGGAMGTAADDDDDDDDSNRTRQFEYESDDSQNLMGFESAADETQQDGSENDDVSSSASSSGVFRSYTNQRIALILNGKSSFATEGGLNSSEGEGLSANARGRSRSVESRNQPHRRSASKTSRRGATNTAPTHANSATTSGMVSQRMTQLEAALSLSYVNDSTEMTPNPSQPPRNAIGASPNVHYAHLDRRRLAAVLSIAKDDAQRAVRLARGYSQLLDHLGVSQTQSDDLQDFVNCKAVTFIMPRQATEGATGSILCCAGRAVTKDGSRLCVIDPRLLPRVPGAGGAVAKKQYAANLIRYLLFVLESVRFTEEATMSQPVSAATNDVSTLPESPITRSPQTSRTQFHVDPTRPVKEEGVPQPNATPQVRKTKTKRMLGNTALRKEDAFTFLLDVRESDSSILSPLSIVLSEGESLLCQAYPLSIARVIVYQGAKNTRGDESGAPSTATTETNGTQKKGPLSLISSLFKAKKANDAPPTTQPTSSLASKVWQSVTFSAWKLRFLHHTVRSRTVMVDNLDPFLDVNALVQLLPSLS